MPRHARAAIALAALLTLAGSACRDPDRTRAEHFLQQLRERFPAAADRLQSRADERLPTGRSADVVGAPPASAEAPLRLSAAGLELQVRALGASVAAAASDGAATVFRDAYSDTDVVQVASPGRYEELLFLRGPSAPRRFDYQVIVDGGRLLPSGEVVDDSGMARLRLAPPWALDARGRRTEASLSIEGDQLTIALDTSGLEAPILLDPSWETTVGTFGQARYDQALALMSDGRLLACGGTADGTTALARCDWYEPLAGTWTAEPSPMAVGHLGATATLLGNGTLLVCGGGNASCETFDPVLRAWTATAPMAAPRSFATATLLANGRVLIAGGDAAGLAELYDPTKRSFSAAGSIAPRARAAAARLGDGRVLVVGGTIASGPVANADLYDPATGSWTAANLPSPRSEHSATRLRTGGVLVAGGTSTGTDVLASALLFDEAKGTWAATASGLVTGRRAHASVLLPSGKALLLGGSDGAASLASTELYDGLSKGFWQSVPLKAARQQASAAVLASGDVLVLGGKAAGAALSSSERYTVDPAVTPVNSMAIPRKGASMTVLASGKVLVAGGYTDGTTVTATAELLDPATGSWAPAGSMVYPEVGHSAHLLADGRVVKIPAEVIPFPPYSTQSIQPEIYDPATNLWSALGPTILAAYRTTALLADGRILAVTASGASLLDPNTGTWVSTPPMNAPRIGGTLTRLSTGKVLLAGGRAGTVLASCEVFDPAAGPAGAWALAGPLAAGRASHTASLLLDGRVLVAGGEDAAGNRVATAEIYDPKTSSWTAAPGLAQARYKHVALTLPSGRVAVAGGQPGLTGPMTASVELYDPGVDRWLPSPGLALARMTFSAAVLHDGSILMAGGNPGTAPATAAAELYREQVGGWRRPAPMTQLLRPLAATPLPGGKALILGSGTISSAEIFDPATGTFTRAASMGTVRVDPLDRDPRPSPFTATLLPTGKVLVTGGGLSYFQQVSTAEIYDPTANSWTPTTGPMAVARFRHSAVALADGRVLIAGGATSCDYTHDIFDPSTGSFTATTSATLTCVSQMLRLADGKVLGLHRTDGSFRIYDPTTNSWSIAGYLRTLRITGDPTLTLLPSGKVLVAGGVDASGAALASAELFDPAKGASAFTAPMTFPRVGHSAVLLPTGKVLVAGAAPPIYFPPTNASTMSNASAEFYDPQTETWRPTIPMENAHLLQAALLMPGAAALLVGTTNGATTTEALLSDPGLDVFAPARPTIATAPAWAAPGDTVALTGSGFRGPAGASGGTSSGAVADLPVLTLMPADGSGLHRFPASSFDDSTLTAKLPAGLGIGHYLLFVTTAGIPSVAAPMQIGKGVVGGPCTADVQCTSGHCVNGVCCASVCGTCQACNLAPTPGICLSVTAGAEDGRTCTLSRACDGTGLCRLRSGQPCAAGSDCLSGFCVDGVCCQSACAATCQSCNVAPVPGMCVPTPAGQPARSGCSGTAACDGAGACKKLSGQPCAAASECQTGFCADGFCCDLPCTGACLACNNPQHQGACGPAPQFSARGCLATQSCDGFGSCKLANGQACATGADCASGRCADGVCCGGSCGPCQACNLPGKLGSCADVAAGQTTASCAAPNACDGLGKCLLVAGSACTGASQCASGFCVDGLCCDGACGGTCQACNLVGRRGTCTPVAAGAPDPDTCAAPKSCDGSGSCKLTAAQACAANGECLSGFCAGGLCCDAACAGPCESCSLAGNLGKCLPVPAGLSAPACAAPRACDGAGVCKLVAAQACASPADCLSGFCVDGQCCDSACTGICQACNVPNKLGSCTPVPRGAADLDTCLAPAVCDGAGACLKVAGQSCAGPSECLSGSCVDGKCCEGACASLGQPCSDKSKCASGQCVDGVCCEGACTGTCQACNVPGSIGRCSPVPKGQLDPDTCAAPNACDGSGGCAMKPSGQICQSAAECLSGHCIDGFCCDSACAGACQACNVPERQGICSSVPRGQGDGKACVGAQACDGAGACLWRQGQPCGDGSQCVTGQCVGNVCCENSCAGQCRSCNLPGKEGQCAFVPAGEQDRDCGGLALACDGAGKCKARNGVPCTGGTECADGRCVDGVCCDSDCAGSCMACGLPGHLGVCTAVPQNETFAGRGCDGSCDGQGTCKRAAGQGCAAAEDCASGYCEKGACQVGGPAAADPNLFAPPRCGCNAGGGGPLLAALGALVALRRRRSAAALAVALLIPAMAFSAEKPKPAKPKPPAAAAKKAPEPPTPPAAATAPAADASTSPPASPIPPPAASAQPAPPPAPSAPAAEAAAAPVASPAKPKAVKVAFLGMQAGLGVESGVAEIVSASFLASIQERPTVRVVSTKELQAVLSYERQRQLIGCSDSGCLAEIGGALGVDQLLSASLGRLGDTLVFSAQLFNAHKAQVEKRYSAQSNGSAEDELLDMSAEAAVGLFGPSPVARTKASAGRTVIQARLEVMLAQERGGAVAATVGYRLLQSLTASAGVLVTGQMGLLARLEWVPFNAQGKVRPVLALEVPVLFARSVAAGIGGSAGVQVSLTRWLSLGLEVPGTWFFTAPAGAQRGYLFAGPTVALAL